MSEQIDGQESLFVTPEMSREQLYEFASDIGRVAATRTVETEKDLSPVMDDLGYRRRDSLAVDPPKVPKLANPHRTRSKIAKDAIGPRYGEEEGVGMPDGKPHYYQAYKELTPEEAAERQAILDGPGHRAVKAALIGIEMDSTSRQADGDVKLQMAIARAKAEKKS
jgi:hypothetical protein